MAKRLHFQKTHALSQLHDEVLAAVPEVRPRMSAPGQWEAVMAVEGRGDDVWLTVPDEADAATIAAVVSAHTPQPPAPPYTRQQRAADVQAILNSPNVVSDPVLRAALARVLGTGDTGESGG